MEDFADNVHIVLVEPENNLNIGAVARAMQNLGFANLHLVTPKEFSVEKASITACWATEILKNCVVHDSLEDALGEMNDVVGFSSSHSKNRRVHVLLTDWTAELATFANNKVALVFGPESTGLRTEHVPHCRTLIRIPSREENPSYNLAQAVLLVLYEIAKNSEQLNPKFSDREMAPLKDLYYLDTLIEKVLTDTEFYSDTTPEVIPDIVKNLFRRTKPDRREIKVLLGIFSSIEKRLANKS